MVRGNQKLEKMRVGPWPDKTGWSDSYSLTSGCCFTFVHELPDDEIAERLMGEALVMISDGVPPSLVFKEFAKIRIWREMGVKLLEGDYECAFRSEAGYQAFNPHTPD